MSSAKVESKAILDLSQNKREFDVRWSELLAQVDASSDTEPVSDEIQELLISKSPKLSNHTEESCTFFLIQKKAAKYWLFYHYT